MHSSAVTPSAARRAYSKSRRILPTARMRFAYRVGLSPCIWIIRRKRSRAASRISRLPMAIRNAFSPYSARTAASTGSFGSSGFGFPSKWSTKVRRNAYLVSRDPCRARRLAHDVPLHPAVLSHARKCEDLQITFEVLEKRSKPQLQCPGKGSSLEWLPTGGGSPAEEFGLEAHIRPPYSRWNERRNCSTAPLSV